MNSGVIQNPSTPKPQKRNPTERGRGRNGAKAYDEPSICLDRNTEDPNSIGVLTADHKGAAAVIERAGQSC